MRLTVFATTAAALWLVLYSIGLKPLDAFLPALLLLLIGAVIDIVTKPLNKSDS